MTHDIAGLERKVRSLQQTISKLHDAKHADALLPIIHRPGWTTLPEFELVQANIDSLHNQASHLHNAFEALIKTAEKIGAKK